MIEVIVAEFVGELEADLLEIKLKDNLTELDNEKRKWLEKYIELGKKMQHEVTVWS